MVSKAESRSIAREVNIDFHINFLQCCVKDCFVGMPYFYMLADLGFYINEYIWFSFRVSFTYFQIESNLKHYQTPNGFVSNVRS